MTGALAPLLAFLLLHFLTGLFLQRLLPVAPPLFAALKKPGAWLDRRLNRKNRKKRALALRGVMTLLLFILPMIALGGAIREISGTTAQWAALLATLFATTGTMQPLHTLRGVAKALKNKNTGEAALLLRPQIATLPDNPDDFTLARKAIEWSAFSLNSWLIAPLFFFAAFGAGGALFYASIAALRATVATDDVAHAYFGLVPRWIDDALNFFSGAITVALIAFAAVFVSRASPLRAISTVTRRGRNYPRGTGEWPVAAMAGALNVTLTGPPWDWIGPEGSSAKVIADDVERCALLHFVVFLCTMALVSAVILSAYFFHI